MNNFDWSDIKIFIVAPREMSSRRLTGLVKHYLPKGNIVFGISKEPYVVGFEDQLQFKMLQKDAIQSIADKVAASSLVHKIYTHVYSQHDLAAIVALLHEGQRVILVNGSWKYAFHNSESYRLAVQSNVSLKFVSPFVDEDEALAYEATHTPFITLPPQGTLLGEEEMFAAADAASLQSYDYSFQTGAALGKAHGDKYEMIATAFNKVIPYQTYALHHGNARERHLSPPHDTNHYDTIHAEMLCLTEAARGNYELDGATLFINLLPCPNCARTLSQTAIDGIVYRKDHSDGYAKEILELCGKKVKQMPSA